MMAAFRMAGKVAIRLTLKRNALGPWFTVALKQVEQMVILDTSYP